MSERPTECKFCGCQDVCRDGFPTIDGGQEIQFECGTVWREDGKSWSQDAMRCKQQVGMLYQRLSKALKTLKAAERFNTIAAWDGEILSARPVADGEWTRADVLDEAIKILEGRP